MDETKKQLVVLLAIVASFKKFYIRAHRQAIFRIARSFSEYLALDTCSWARSHETVIMLQDYY